MGLLDDLEEFGQGLVDLTVNSEVFDNIVDVGLQYSTYGLVGWEDGRLKSGVVYDVSKNALDRVTGRDLMKEQMRRAEARLAAEELRREQDLADQRRIAEQNDLLASRSAQSLRSTGNRSIRSVRAASAPSSGGSLLGDEGDFLGL